MSAGCTKCPLVLFIHCAAISLAHANQLPLPRLQGASGHESDS